MRASDERVKRPLPSYEGPSRLPPTARRILEAARSIVAERGYGELTMSALEEESGANRALVSYYFGDKAGLVTALVDSLFFDPDAGALEQIRDSFEGEELTERFLEWQAQVSRNNRANRMLYELLPHALKDPATQRRFADMYHLYRTVDADCLQSAPAELSAEQAEVLAAVAIAVVEGLAMQRAVDPDGFDHERAWRCWRDVVGCYLRLPAPPDTHKGPEVPRALTGPVFPRVPAFQEIPVFPEIPASLDGPVPEEERQP